ncbi:MAG: hypothetical protein PPP55_07710 [Halorubrum sp.]
MSDERSTVEAYFDPLTATQRTSLRARMERYRPQLEDRGYEVAVAEGTGGLFGGVLVIDDERGRVGFLESNGSVAWIDGSASGLGALGSAITQNHTEALGSTVEFPDGVDVD